MSSSVLASLWREGLSMDSSIPSDDEDCVDWRWPASSPRRCDRERVVLDTEINAAHQNNSGWTTSCSCSRSSSNASASHGSLEENLFYCTEELGSESVCGSADPCMTAPEKRSAPKVAGRHDSSLHVSDDLPAPHPHHHHHHHHQQQYHSSAAVRSGRTCNFPPPISSLLTDRPFMRSFKSNGRFILKKVTNVSRSLFRATRSNGSLRLDLLPSSSDCVKSQQCLFFSAGDGDKLDTQSSSPSEGEGEPVHDSCPNMKHSTLPYHLLSSPFPYSIFLNHAAVCGPSKLQAFAMLVSPRRASVPVEKKLDAAAAMVNQTVSAEAAMVNQSRPRVFALLKVLPRGLGLIIFEVSGKKSKEGGQVRVHGMCILESSGAQCGRAAMATTPSHDHLIPTNCLMGASMEDPKGKLSPLSHGSCRGDRYMVKGVFA